MPLNLNGAGRSSTLDRLPTASGLVAATRTQYWLLCKEAMAPKSQKRDGTAAGAFARSSGPPRAFQGPPAASKLSKEACQRPRAVSGTTTYNKDEFVLLTKMDRTEFRS